MECHHAPGWKHIDVKGLEGVDIGVRRGEQPYNEDEEIGCPFLALYFSVVYPGEPRLTRPSIKLAWTRNMWASELTPCEEDWERFREEALKRLPSLVRNKAWEGNRWIILG